jgi:hypothetical protein
VAAAAKSDRAALAVEKKLAKDRRGGRTMRQQFVDTISKEGDLPLRFTIGSPDTMLLVDPTGGACSLPLLKKLVEISGDPMRNVGFDTIACGDRSAAVAL